MNAEHLEYAVIFETGPRNLSAYVPDLPGCVATGKTRDETRDRIREAIRLHIELLRETKQPVPLPTSLAEQVAV